MAIYIEKDTRDSAVADETRENLCADEDRRRALSATASEEKAWRR
jgi:hypothetical protein